MSLPTAKEDLDFALANSEEPITSRRETVVTARLGTSMPTTEILPGTAAIRTPVAPRLNAISSAAVVSLLRRTPFSSSTSYRVTLGPRVTLIICASILKLANVSFKRFVFSRISAVPSAAPLPGSFSRSIGGKQYSGFFSDAASAISFATSAADSSASCAVTFFTLTVFALTGSAGSGVSSGLSNIGACAIGSSRFKIGIWVGIVSWLLLTGAVSCSFTDTGVLLGSAEAAATGSSTSAPI